MLEFLDVSFAAYLAIGLVVGFLAGMIGLGGGAIIVPITATVFSARGFPAEHILRMALATSMASIIFVSFSSMRAHHRHAAVNWKILKQMTPGLVAGGFFGTWLARYIPTIPLAIFFAAFVFYAGTNMLIGWKPGARTGTPGAVGMFIAGFVICAVAALVAVGGAAMVIPFLLWCSVPFHIALGTAAAVGFPISIAASLGYIANGWNIVDLPRGSLGYVYLPAVLGIAIGSAVLAPVGAKLAHGSSVKTLRTIMAFVLYALAIKLIWGLL